MHRELTEPLSNPDRLVKVATRLNTFMKYFKYDHSRCDPKDYKITVENELMPILDYIAEYIKKHKFESRSALIREAINEKINQLDIFKDT